MEFVVYKTSSYEYSIKRFSTLKELVDFQKKNGEIIILDNPFKDEDPKNIMKWQEIKSASFAIRLSKIEKAIEIYDDYRE